MKYLSGASVFALLISSEIYSLIIVAIWLAIGTAALFKEMAAHNIH